MATDTMDPATAVTWGPFIQAAYEQFVSAPSVVNPSTIKNMPAGYTWDLVPFAQVTGGGKVAQGFYGIYNTFGTMTPGQRQSIPAPGAFAAEVAHAVADGFAAGLDPGLPTVVCGHSLGCAHALNTYLHVLSPAAVPLDPACKPGS